MQPSWTQRAQLSGRYYRAIDFVEKRNVVVDFDNEFPDRDRIVDRNRGQTGVAHVPAWKTIYAVSADP